MKKKNLIKKLIITSIVWLIINCVAAGVYFWLDSDIEYMQQETQQKIIAKTLSRNEIETITKNIKNSEIAAASFIEFTKSDDNNKNSFRRNELIRKLGEITSELRAVKVSFTMTPFVQYTNIPSSDKVDIVYSQVAIKYEALTDITAFKILKLLSEKLNGNIYFKKFDITKKGEIDSDVLLKISNGEIPSLVDGNIEFDWISIRLKELKEIAPSATTPTTPTTSPQPAGGQNV